MKISLFKFLFILSLHFLSILCQPKPCNRKFYPDGFVCVCNSSYCDTVESVDKIDSNNFYQEFVTSKSRYRLEKFKFKFDLFPSKDAKLKLTVKRTKTYQKIIGFGGAISDSTGLNTYSLSNSTAKNLIKSYFAPEGIEYNILRVPVAGTDFSTRPYTYNDLPGDFNLTNFSLSFEDFKWKIPFIKSAFKYSRKEANIKLFASAWTAPPWMKTNNRYNGRGFLIGPPGGIYYQTWANYYLKFFQAYRQQNLNFWGVTAGNQPINGFIIGFPFNAMGFSPETQAEFIISNLGPTLEKNGFSDIKIMILDENRFLPGWARKVFAYSPNKTRKYVSGIGVHWYLNPIIPASVLDKTNAEFPEKWILGTEASYALAGFGPAVLLGSFHRAECYVKDIIEDLNHWVTGWTDWNMALDESGGPNWAGNFVDSPIIVNRTSDEFYKQPMFYAMGHFSKFIPENSVRIKIQAQRFVGHDVHYVALKNDELRQVILVLQNKGKKDFKYSIFDSESGKYINSLSEAHSFKTIIWHY